MPPYISYLLQPLDVGVFGQLKHAYRKLVGVSQAMAWILVVGHALNLVLNKVSATSVYSLGIAASKLRKGDPSS